MGLRSALSARRERRSQRNLLPLSVEHAEDGSIVLRRRWWPPAPGDSLPLMPPRVAHFVVGSLLATGATLLASATGWSRELLRGWILPSILLGGALGAGVLAHRRFPPFIVFDRVRRELRVGGRVEPFRSLGRARPRVIANSSPSGEELFDVRLTLPDAQQLLLGRFRSRDAAMRLTESVTSVIER